MAGGTQQLPDKTLATIRAHAYANFISPALSQPDRFSCRAQRCRRITAQGARHSAAGWGKTSWVGSRSVTSWIFLWDSGQHALSEILKGGSSLGCSHRITWLLSSSCGRLAEVLVAPIQKHTVRILSRSMLKTC